MCIYIYTNICSILYEIQYLHDGDIRECCNEFPSPGLTFPFFPPHSQRLFTLPLPALWAGAGHWVVMSALRALDLVCALVHGSIRVCNGAEYVWQPWQEPTSQGMGRHCLLFSNSVGAEGFVWDLPLSVLSSAPPSAECPPEISTVLASVHRKKDSILLTFIHLKLRVLELSVFFFAS